MINQSRPQKKSFEPPGRKVEWLLRVIRQGRFYLGAGDSASSKWKKSLHFESETTNFRRRYEADPKGRLFHSPDYKLFKPVF